MSYDLFKQKGLNGDVYVCEYWGGDKNKECVQITLPSCGYIQFTKKKARIFAKQILKKLEAKDGKV